MNDLCYHCLLLLEKMVSQTSHVDKSLECCLKKKMKTKHYLCCLSTKRNFYFRKRKKISPAGVEVGLP